jgi:hypothetical protein
MTSGTRCFERRFFHSTCIYFSYNDTMKISTFSKPTSENCHQFGMISNEGKCTRIEFAFADRFVRNLFKRAMLFFRQNYVDSFHFIFIFNQYNKILLKFLSIFAEVFSIVECLITSHCNEFTLEVFMSNKIEIIFIFIFTIQNQIICL